jgi:hypothetical protein
MCFQGCHAHCPARNEANQRSMFFDDVEENNLETFVSHNHQSTWCKSRRWFGNLSAAASACFIRLFSHNDITEGYRFIIRIETAHLGIVETLSRVIVWTYFNCSNVLIGRGLEVTRKFSLLNDLGGWEDMGTQNLLCALQFSCGQPVGCPEFFACETLCFALLRSTLILVLLASTPAIFILSRLGSSAVACGASSAYLIDLSCL